MTYLPTKRTTTTTKSIELQLLGEQFSFYIINLVKIYLFIVAWRKKTCYNYSESSLCRIWLETFGVEPYFGRRAVKSAVIE